MKINQKCCLGAYFAGFTCTCKYFYVVSPAHVVLWNSWYIGNYGAHDKGFSICYLTYFFWSFLSPRL